MTPDTKLVPCKDCADRHPACHDSCDKYKEFKKIHDTKRELINQYKSQYSELYGHKNECIRKAMRIKAMKKK